jgi:hypothetical protein
MMSNRTRIKNSTLGVIIGLEISVLCIFMGLDFGFKFGAGFDDISYMLTLGGHRHTILPIIALALIPICARENRWGFFTAMCLGIVTLSLSLIHSMYMLMCSPPGFEEKIFGPLVWSVMQIPIIAFGYKASRGLRKKKSIKR